MRIRLRGTDKIIKVAPVQRKGGNMPKTNLGKRNEKDQAIFETVTLYLARRDMKKADLARATKIPVSTLCKALRQMEYLKVSQLRLIYDALRVPAEERRGL